MENNKNLEQEQSPSVSLRSNPKSQWLQSISSEFEAKTKKALDLIVGDGDTFSERAQMYYQNRPQVIQTVHDLQKLYMTLADKYENLLSKTELSPMKIELSDSSDNQSPLPGEEKTGECNSELNLSNEAVACNVESMEDYPASGSGSSTSSFEFQSPQVNLLPSPSVTSTGFKMTENEDGDIVVSRQEERRSSVGDNMTCRKKEDEPREDLPKLDELIRRKDEKKEKSGERKNDQKTFLKSFRSFRSPKSKKKADQSAGSKSKSIKGLGFFCLPK